jgi:hypothetical protein
MSAPYLFEAHTMAFAALAILGHRSAHSFPMGPVIADPAGTPEGLENLMVSSITEPKRAGRDVVIYLHFHVVNPKGATLLVGC